MISRAVLNLVLLDFTMGAPNKGDVLSVVIVRALLDRLGVGLDDAVVALALEVLVREMLFVLAVLFFSSAPGFVLLDLLGEIVAAFAAVLVLLDSIGGPAISFLVLLDLTGAAGTLVLVDFDVFDKALALVLGLNLVLDDNVENSLLLFVGKAGMEGLLLWSSPFIVAWFLLSDNPRSVPFCAQLVTRDRRLLRHVDEAQALAVFGRVERETAGAAVDLQGDRFEVSAEPLLLLFVVGDACRRNLSSFVVAAVVCNGECDLALPPLSAAPLHLSSLSSPSGSRTCTLDANTNRPVYSGQLKYCTLTWL